MEEGEGTGFGGEPPSFVDHDLYFSNECEKSPSKCNKGVSENNENHISMSESMAVMAREILPNQWHVFQPGPTQSPKTQNFQSTFRFEISDKGAETGGGGGAQASHFLHKIVLFTTLYN